MKNKNTSIACVNIAEDLYSQFHEETDFVKNIDALQNVTPSSWRVQQSRAWNNFEQKVKELFAETVMDLHNGEYTT